MNPDSMLYLLYFAWVALFALVYADVLTRRRAGLSRGGPPAPPDPPAWTLKGLIGLAGILALIRIPLAVGREVRSVDEVQYAATAAFVKNTGESLFGWAWNLHGHQVLYLLGSREEPFAAVDAITSLVVGLTGLLLGMLVLRARGGHVAALLTVPCYVLGLVAFEGLSSNKEPYVNLFLALYLLVRLGRVLDGEGKTSPGRQVLAGACLGAAVVMKEQAILFVLLEPLVALLDLIRDRRGTPGRALALRFLRDQALAALGFLIPVCLLLLGFLIQGQLSAYLAFIVEWGTSGGAPMGGMQGSPPPPNPLSFPSQFVLGFTNAWIHPVGLLGLAYSLRIALEARSATHPERRLLVGLALAVVIGVVAISIGRRWFGHYFMLLLPALAPLAALRAVEGAREIRLPTQRLAVGVLLILACVLVALQVRLLFIYEGQQMAQGNGLAGEDRARLNAIAKLVHERTHPRATILVWGWRPELYFAADRLPATRYVGGVTATKREVLADLERFEAPAVVVLPGSNGLVSNPEDDPFELAKHPDLLQWMTANGFQRRGTREQMAGYEVWAR